MKKILWIIVLVLIAGGYYAYKQYQESQSCPDKDPIGLYTDCTPHVQGGTPQNPLGI